MGNDGLHLWLSVTNWFCDIGQVMTLELFLNPQKHYSFKFSVCEEIPLFYLFLYSIPLKPFQFDSLLLEVGNEHLLQKRMAPRTEICNNGAVPKHRSWKEPKIRGQYRQKQKPTSTRGCFYLDKLVTSISLVAMALKY